MISCESPNFAAQMLRLGNISYHLPQGFLYKDISLFIDRGDKIGLCGKNGVGKSTLLGIISNQITPTEGEVTAEKKLTIGYLTQDIQIRKDVTVRAYMEGSNQEIQKMQERLSYVNDQLTERTDYESNEYSGLIEEVSEINDRLTVLDAHEFAEKIELVLKGLGFRNEDLDNLIGTFSGGWQMRVELAQLLVNNPDLLLIDEPTNHLDIVSIQWLEIYLKQFKGGLILISHDRRFLDTVTNRTIEIANQQLYDYKCNYSKYLVLHAEEMERAIQAKKNQDREIKRTEDLINKYRAKANKAAFAQSLIKKLDKVERIEIDSIERQTFNLRFALDNPSGKRVADIRELTQSYGDKQIFNKLDALLSRGDKIALLGPNGVGKSTLVKCLIDEIEYAGEVEYGHNVKIGYFAQDSPEGLDPNKTVFETVDAIAKGDKRKDIRNVLGAFLFGTDDVDKKVKVLSGGERTRLVICQLLFQDFNFLIMDEPTNHLDIQSKDILKEALNAYQGTLLLVSHDRDFLDGFSNKIWEIQEGKIREHYFGVNEFLSRLTFEGMNIDVKKPKKLSAGKAAKKAKKSEKSQISNKARFQSSKEEKTIRMRRRKLKSDLKKIEQKISGLEIQLKECTSKLEITPFDNTNAYNLALNELNESQLALDEAMVKWESISHELEVFEP
ncbi:ABC-F family ATP-binding cassette domain-containing protein [bacterium AH-315-C20]|nr:ABC-F family ATP-binding cassette domain-containing protein [bacterium AH-315-C20]